MKVRDVMTHGVVAVHPNLPLKEAARLLERHGISGLPVVDEAGAVVGVLSEADLLMKEVGSNGPTPRRFGWLLGETHQAGLNREKADAATVAEAMSHPPIFVAPGESVRVAARTMVERRINRLPVVDGGQLVGILTRADIARTFLVPDEDIAQAVRAEIARCATGFDLRTFDVSVREGVVRVTGTVDRWSTAEVLSSLIRQLDGVVAAETDLSWAFDDSNVQAPGRDYLNLPWRQVR